MTNFDARIKRIEQEITDLKSISRKATSVLTTTAQDITLTTTIQRQGSPGSYYAQTINDGVAEIIMDEPGFISATATTPGGPRGTGRGLEIWQTSTESGNPCVRATYWRLSDADYASMGSSPVQFSLTIRVIATASFTAVTREEPHA